MKNYIVNRFVDKRSKVMSFSIIARIKVREIFNFLAFVTFMLTSQLAVADLNYDFIKMATFGNAAKAKELLKSNPQIRSMASSTSDIRLIEEAMIKAAGAKNASYDFVKLMIDNGADVSANFQGYTLYGSALGNAIGDFNTYSETYIKTNKLYIDMGFWSKETASREERLKIIDLLIKEGADIDETMSNGTSILRVALNKDKIIAIKLLDAGANPNPVNPQNLFSLIDMLKEEIKIAEEMLPTTQDPILSRKSIDLGNRNILLLQQYIKN